MKVGLLYTLMRKEEKLLREALEKKGIEVIKLDDKRLTMTLGENPFPELDAVLVRSLSLTQGLVWSKFFESFGIPVMNSFSTLQTCGNKYLTTLALLEHNVATPKVMVSFDTEATITAMETTGFPCVLKPVIGSYGRMIAKINDKEAAEAVLEHKQNAQGLYKGLHYVQEYIDKPGRDIRVLVIGNEVAGAIYRKSEHWKTNTALGAVAEHCPLTEEIKTISLQAAQAVGGGILTVDVFETDSGPIVNEVNGVAEFGKSLDAYGIDIPELIASHVVKTISIKKFK